LACFGQAQCADSALGAGPGAEDDAAPDQQFGCLRLGLHGIFRLGAELGEGRFALVLRQLVVDFGPARLQLLQALLALVAEGECRQADEAGGGKQKSAQGVMGFPFRMVAGKAFDDGQLLAQRAIHQAGSRLLSARRRFSGQPRKAFLRSRRRAETIAAATTSGSSMATFSSCSSPPPGFVHRRARGTRGDVQHLDPGVGEFAAQASEKPRRANLLAQ
jgi:hypothetical protein